ncbi:MAG: PD-(D/E)XK nuclease family protein [Janthinobacterium lividum]
MRTTPNADNESQSSDRILEALERGAILLTPNTRSARFWSEAFDARAMTQQGQSWRAATILPWRAWAASQWQEAIILGLDERVLLNDVQEHAVWTEVIRQLAPDSLRSAAAHASLCMEAGRLLGSYDVEARFLRMGFTAADRESDTATFHGWYKAFEALCSRERYLPSAHLDAELAALLRQNRMTTASEYLLCGFPDLLPAQLAVVETLRGNDAAVHSFNPVVARQSAPTLLACETPEVELLDGARWLREQLEAQPERSIALVVPNLHACRTELERILRATLAPETADVTRTDASAPYEFSVGRPMQQLPMIQDAMRLLRWCLRELPIDEAGAILRSRHLSLADSPEAGAEQDANVLRAKPRLQKKVSLRQAAEALAKYSTAANLAALDQQARPLRNATNSCANFADGARKLLESAGWPGAAPLNSDEFQAVDRWNRMLDTLGTLDLLGRPAKLGDFLAQLDALAGRTQFLPENLGAAVQVMTLHEAAGSTAEAVWFLHANSDTWPGRPQPHPLLPFWLQRELGMPGLDVTRDETVAGAALDQLLRGAGSVRFTWSRGSEEDAGSPSPIIERLVAQHGGSFGEAQPAAEEAMPAQVERFLDDEQLPALRDGHVAGGVGVLTAQAQCGFRAFAEKRLFAAPMEAMDAGLSPRERGEQVHAVLQMFWEEVRDQQALIRMGNEMADDGLSRRDHLLFRCIQAACRTGHGEAWDDAYLHVQQRRLFSLLSAWLQVEAERPPFTVLQIEQEIKNVPVGPLLLNMRVDRIDRVTAANAEGTVLIDYKTGPASPNEWIGERLDAPQLPAYVVAGALAAGIEQVDGLLFASVRVGDKAMKLDGVADSLALIGPKARSKYDFTEQVDHWREDLQALAEAFASGDASVDPKNYPRTCDTCSQRILCRVDAATLLQLEELQAEAEEDEASAWA